MATTDTLLDSSIVIDFLRKANKSNSVFVRLFDPINQPLLYISVITRFEVEVGLKSDNQKAQYQDLLDRVIVLPVDETTITQAVTVHRYLKSINRLIEFEDLLIAATALRYQLPVATLNLDHFRRVPYLQVMALPSL